MINEILKVPRTKGDHTPTIGQEARVHDTETGFVFRVVVTGVSEEFIEVEKLEQIIETGNELISVIGGTLNVNAEMKKKGTCSRFKDQEVMLVHKIVNNVLSMVCEVEGKRYISCEEGCPIYVKR